MTAPEQNLKGRIEEDVKAAMRARDRQRLGILRLCLAAIKQREVDERTTLDDTGVLAVLDKMVKQRRDSAQQYADAGRTDLADQESYEISVIQEYMPPALAAEDLDALIVATISRLDASSPKDMGKVMSALKPQVQGRADMNTVSARVRDQLGRL